MSADRLVIDEFYKKKCDSSTCIAAPVCNGVPLGSEACKEFWKQLVLVMKQ